MKFTAGKIMRSGKIVEVLGITPEKGISVCSEVYSDKALEQHRYIPLTTLFVWVREFNFKDQPSLLDN
jgi:hypothetical protein